MTLFALSINYCSKTFHIVNKTGLQLSSVGKLCHVSLTAFKHCAAYIPYNPSLITFSIICSLIKIYTTIKNVRVMLTSQ